MAPQFYEAKRSRWYDLCKWRLIPWAAAATVVVAIAVVIAVPVIVARHKANANADADRYPNYTKLNYSINETYSTARFFDNFNYRTGGDPSNGHVHYVDLEYAVAYNLTPTLIDSVMVKVDTSIGPSSSPDASTGRFSVRLESKRQYNQGLFVFDIKHTPYGCATWPALWLADPYSWPAHGEIDVMEAINHAAPSDPNPGNLVTLHTDASCSMDVKRNMTGSTPEVFGSGTPATDCDVSPGTNNNAGCGVTGGPTTYGGAFNAAGGGIMAVEWRSEGIRIWQFGRAAIPADIGAGKPDPSIWPPPLADFPNTNCDIGGHFKNASIIANIDLCGDAIPESVWAASGCLTPCVGSHKCVGGWTQNNCTDFVSNNPQAFINAYWEFGEFKVYQSS
ncbi:concanavalin A-like lectin/glucanase domain-containing protein [Lasiosphaeria miniovina]|uniref:Concanavalin A-like lectin/glucanase domain-containing protein n=1 Tax=Lasiosphaeria miniovina TaxID=1954250 RepID=A0AA40ATM3_9PEZI|nr:concanavalin A-like lectin/glucanase domain-containing protein [Lasiosphaeria miniovina]KAK0721785.1 concanavalin A-like lectin/glucanase domain-containing protein [Lasiosphaeria miniovina]